MSADLALTVGIALGIAIGLVWQALWPILPSRWKRNMERRWGR